MLEQDFNDFWERVNFNKKNGIFPIINCLEEEDKFTFMFRSGEQGEWKYYTIVEKEDINGHSEENNVSTEEGLEDFRNNYCSNTVPIKPYEFNYLEYSPRYVRKDEIIEPGEDVVDESEDYEAFMINELKRMEKKVVNSIDNIEFEKAYMNKTFGEFVRDLFNSVNTLPFAKRIKTFVRSGLKEGLDSAEEEIGVGIGFTAVFSDKVNILAEQQLNGYTLSDGKRWTGIKGASKDLQINILRSVQDDVINRVSKKEMTKNIQDIFRGSGWNQATRIVRTESNRFISEGKLTGYRESGIPGRKAWDAVGDKDTSPICLRLHAKYFEKGIPFDDEFVDDVSGWHGQIPPAHPNCRSTPQYRKALI